MIWRHWLNGEGGVGEHKRWWVWENYVIWAWQRRIKKTVESSNVRCTKRKNISNIGHNNISHISPNINPQIYEAIVPKEEEIGKYLTISKEEVPLAQHMQKDWGNKHLLSTPRQPWEDGSLR